MESYIYKPVTAKLDFGCAGFSSIEITDLNNVYLKDNQLDVAFVAGQWFDTGTFESLYEAIAFVRDKKIKAK